MAAAPSSPSIWCKHHTQDSIISLVCLHTSGTRLKWSHWVDYTCQKREGLTINTHYTRKDQLLNNSLLWNRELQLAATFAMGVCLSLRQQQWCILTRSRVIISLFPVRWATVLISLTHCPTHTLSVGVLLLLCSYSLPCWMARFI